MSPGPTAPEGLAERRALALRVREHAARMAGRGGCFLGGALSCVELLVHLYARVLRVSPATLADPDRDRFLLSKGHAVPALYGTLAELGFFPRDLLERHLGPGGLVYWHPSRSLPGVEFHSGSLGHLLGVGVGLALDAAMRGSRARTFVLVGDGELDEGSNWEALLVAAARGLDRLVVVIDRNGLQANLPTEALVPLEPLADKLRAFGLAVRDVDGHDLGALEAAFTGLPASPGRPTAIVARTERGHGLPGHAGRPDRWFVKASAEEVERLVAGLRAAASGEGA